MVVIALALLEAFLIRQLMTIMARSSLAGDIKIIYTRQSPYHRWRLVSIGIWHLIVSSLFTPVIILTWLIGEN